MNTPRFDHGLSLAPFRAARYPVDGAELGDRLSPPYDVISAALRADLAAGSNENVVRLILPGAPEESLGDGDGYLGARVLLDRWVGSGVLRVEQEPALFVYEMRSPDGQLTRGLVGAVQLRDPDDGVILPHENTMAGPVSDRLALMSATEANLEPIYLVYDGGGAASQLVASVSGSDPTTTASTLDGVLHRLWSVTDPSVLADVATDLRTRRALIADGHHRYATYRQLQAQHSGQPGPWDRGLTLLVDSSSYGPQVHPIHRVLAMGWTEILDRSNRDATVSAVTSTDAALAELASTPGFAVVAATSRDQAAVISSLAAAVVDAGLGAAAGTPLASLDVSMLHSVLIKQVWQLSDDPETVGFAHSVDEALAAAAAISGVAVLVRPTPVRAVAQVAAQGARMPRKSTLFTPKPASGLLFRRFCDQ